MLAGRTAAQPQEKKRVLPEKAKPSRTAGGRAAGELEAISMRSPQSSLCDAGGLEGLAIRGLKRPG
jgi:hypothetical protein